MSRVTTFWDRLVVPLADGQTGELGKVAAPHQRRLLDAAGPAIRRLCGEPVEPDHW